MVSHIFFIFFLMVNIQLITDCLGRIIDVVFASDCLAYEVLSDSEKRNIYDRYGEEGLKQHAATGGGKGGGMGMNINDIFSK